MQIPDNLKPIGDRVLVRTDPRPEKSNGVIMPHTAREKLRTATVLTHPNVHHEWSKGLKRWVKVVPDPAVKPGARVLLTKLSVDAQDYSDEGMLMVVHYKDIGAVEE